MVYSPLQIMIGQIEFGFNLMSFYFDDETSYSLLGITYGYDANMMVISFMFTTVVLDFNGGDYEN